MAYYGQTARGQKITAAKVLKDRFGEGLTGGGISAQFVSFGKEPLVIGAAGLKFDSPLIRVIAASGDYSDLISKEIGEGYSLLFLKDKILREKGGKVEECDVSASAAASMIDMASGWGGSLNGKGELTFDPATPAPGPHYYTNMLIGNRIGSPRPLQSTPKSAVGMLGGGCFRAHADTQVLATKWDYLPEENGFPANRQFYLVSGGKNIFYSGLAKAEGLKSARTTHSQNRTVIEYELDNGLKVRRTIFILPAKEGLPLACEAQMIDIENNSADDMDLRIVYTGMFGTDEVHALREDVIFSTVVAQSEIFFDENDDLRAVSFNPNPKWTKGNIRFHVAMLHKDGETIFPDEYCARYDDFVGNGTLADPEFIAPLACAPSRKGPGFFAVSTPFALKAGEKVRADNFTCLSSDAVNSDYVVDKTCKVEAEKLIECYKDEAALAADYAFVCDFADRYSSYMKISSEDPDFEAYVNNNLPFQVFYQTFVSRSLDWTQKGYREIGFREIQDIFASMYYFAGMGRTDFIKSLLREWIENVYTEGYANHNFYWKGKEPGWWSDDALWLLQALDRYVSLTGDVAFLKEEFAVAGSDEKRTLLDTIKAIITYSAKISVGSHGIPLIDRADWNDCLRVDPDCISGAEKIELYKQQLAESGAAYGEEAFKSEYSESVMNGFLLKVATDAASVLFDLAGDAGYAEELRALSGKIREGLRENAWKGDFYARVLFNRKDKPSLKYLGASGDGLAVEDAPGTYFLNSFSWALLSGCADEKQIETMLDSIDNYLKSPYGYRLCSTVDYPQIAPKIDVMLYYPGDRENGGVFKHANMMAASAMLKNAKTVSDPALAERLADTAYWIIDRILPFRTLKSPFTVCGNPRWCTQYNNSDSGENIGPTLSGTSTWLLLCLFQCFGVEFTADHLDCKPILRKEDRELNVDITTERCSYKIHITKGEGFVRTVEGVKISVDGNDIEGTEVPVFEDGQVHNVEVAFQ
ncbi:MAG: glycosyl transferase [Clostridiales bacterium]|nr:glycosyl transferase [Clostridiales bacterium]